MVSLSRVKLTCLHFGLEKGVYRTIHIFEPRTSRNLETKNIMVCCALKGLGPLCMPVMIDPYWHSTQLSLDGQPK